jgi:DNA helicase HerA-like ATPase
VNVLHKASHVFVGGKSGMGKTTFALRYILGSPQTRVFIFDHQGEFAVRLGIEEKDTATNLERFFELAEVNRIVPFDFTVSGADKESAFAAFCDAAFDTAEALESSGHSSLFVCDELQQFVSAQNCPPEFKRIVETGRRYNLDTLSLSQRPNAVNAAIREQFTEMILFRLQDENSLKFATAIGADTDAVMRLPPHHFLYYNVINGGERAGEVSFVKRGSNK